MATSGYTIDNIDFLDEWSCQILDVDGHLGFPERKSPTEIDLGHNSQGAYPYTDAADIRFMPRDITLEGVIQAATLANAFVYLEAMQSYLSSPGLKELELNHAENTYMVYLKDGGSVQPVGKWNTNDTTLKVSFILREPLPSFPAIWQDVQYFWNGADDRTEGNAYQFDGTDDYGQITDDAKFQDIFDGGGSICCWIYPKSDGQGNFGRISHKGGWEFYTENESNGSVSVKFYKSFLTNTGYWSLSSAIIPLNEWSYILIAYDASSTSNNPTIYVNGESYTVNNGLSKGSTPVGTATSDSGTDMYIGNRTAGNRTFDGAISQVHLWNVELDSTEAKQLYSSGIVPYKYQGASQTEISSGSLTVGKAYEITAQDGEDFTLDGAADNNVGTQFVATGTNVTLDANDKVKRIGCIVDLNQSKTSTVWYDDSGNNLDASMSITSVTGEAYPTTHEETFQSSFAVSMWVKPDDGQPSSAEYFCGTKDTTPDNQFYVQLPTTGKIQAVYEANGTSVTALTNSAVFSNGAESWHHIAVIVDSKKEQIDIWFDGTKQTLDSINDGDMDGVDMTAYSNSNNFGWHGIIDDDGLKDMLNGEIDNYKLYNKKLSAEEVAVIYNKGR